MKAIQLLLLLLLGGCASYAPGTLSTAGTSVHFAGQICGQDADFSLSDIKDRSSATALVTCPGQDGGSVSISTADSSASAVMAQQAQIISQLSAVVASMAAQAGGVAYVSPKPGTPRAEVAARMQGIAGWPL